MKNVTALLRDSMKVKPASKRGARQKTSTPKGVTRLNFNENNYGPAPEVTKLLIDSIGRVNEYQDFFAIDLKQKIADFYGLDKTAEAASETNEFGENSKPEDYVIIGAGSSAVIDMLGEIFINPGDEVVYCMPSYESFPDMVNDYGGKRVEIPLTADYHFDLDGMYEAVTEKTKLVVVVNPNNPTGTTITKSQLQEWVDYANKVGAVIIYDAAYEAYISEDDVAHSIYECEGAKTCAIELRSFSKNAGFTGVRLGFTVVPKELKCGDVSLNAMWARRHGTKFNGAPYIVQRAGEAVYSDAGKAQLKEQVGYYMKNAKAIKEGLTKAGYTVFGGVNAPYIWLKTPDQMSSWDFFDYLLENANVVGTPGSGFGPSGEGYFRLTAFGTYENTLAAMERIQTL